MKQAITCKNSCKQPYFVPTTYTQHSDIAKGPSP